MPAIRSTWRLCSCFSGVCVEQNNIEERNHQVDKISRVFSNAAFVLVWLGPKEDDSDLAMEHIAAASDESASPRELRTRVDPKLLENSIIALSRRSYWRRLWIVQEIILAPNVLILCGYKLPFLA